MGGLFQITLFTYSQQGRKSDPRTSDFGGFLDSKSCQDQEKVPLKSLQKSGRFSIRFFIDLGSILEPTGHPKIVYFSSNFALGVALGPSWRQEGAQSAPRQLQRSIFQEFGIILGSILEEISKISKRVFNTTSTRMSHSMLTFSSPLKRQAFSSQLQFSVFWHGGGFSRVAHWIYIYIYIYMCVIN